MPIPASDLCFDVPLFYMDFMALNRLRRSGDTLCRCSSSCSNARRCRSLMYLAGSAGVLVHQVENNRWAASTAGADLFFVDAWG